MRANFPDIAFWLLLLVLLDCRWPTGNRYSGITKVVLYRISSVVSTTCANFSWCHTLLLLVPCLLMCCYHSIMDILPKNSPLLPIDEASSTRFWWRALALFTLWLYDLATRGGWRHHRYCCCCWSGEGGGGLSLLPDFIIADIYL